MLNVSQERFIFLEQSSTHTLFNYMKS